MLGKLRQANQIRQKEWSGSDKADTAFRTIEIGGEFGELSEAIGSHLINSMMAVEVSGRAGKVMEAIKKQLRDQRGIQGNKADLEDVKEELGDCVIVLDLLAGNLGIDLEKAVKDKFNKTSRKYNLKTMIA